MGDRIKAESPTGSARNAQQPLPFGGIANLGVGLPDWIDLTRALLAGLRPAERFVISHGNARRVYGLPQATGP